MCEVFFSTIKYKRKYQQKPFGFLLIFFLNFIKKNFNSNQPPKPPGGLLKKKRIINIISKLFIYLYN